MREVQVRPRPLSVLDGIARRPDLDRMRTALLIASRRLAGRTVWHVNSTSEGGGVAELLHQLLGYVVAGDIACRWLVLEGDRRFFEITKRIHNRLHGSEGDGGRLADAEHAAYAEVVDRNLATLLDRARAGDVVVLHDPQTAGLAGPLVGAGLVVVWVCHVGVDTPNEVVRSAWRFLHDDVEPAHAYVFSRRAYAWEGLDAGRITVIPPCVDPTSVKNVQLDAAQTRAILAAGGVLALPDSGPARFELAGIGAVDVRRRADAVEDAPAPSDAPLVVQVSRWDRLKDHVGVLRGFAEHVPADLGAHLLLAGPAAGSVADDPEGGEVVADLIDVRRDLPGTVRSRVHVISLPMDDRLENALVVNALQRAATVVVQKSLAEGFGLTVAEAMWKTRPVVASRVGGIQDQVLDGQSGLLVEPSDLDALGRSVVSLVEDTGFAQAIGHAGRERVRAHFLPPQFLQSHLSLVTSILDSHR